MNLKTNNGTQLVLSLTNGYNMERQTAFEHSSIDTIVQCFMCVHVDRWDGWVGGWTDEWIYLQYTVLYK